jgi:hypothetical protein
MTGLLLAAAALPAAAAETGTSYSGGAGARYVDLDHRGSLGQVYEYNGKTYKYAHGDLWLSREGEKGLFDFGVFDIGSAEENGFFQGDYKDSVRLRAKYDSMHHRADLVRTGIIINGAWTPTSHFTVEQLPAGQELLFKRSQTDVSLDVFDPADPAKFLSAEYFMAEKRGQSEARGTNVVVGVADVNNTKHEMTLGAGTSIRQNAAAAIEVVRSEFEDKANAVNPLSTGGILRPNYPRQSMTGGAVKFRYQAGKRLALTGALTANDWENLTNQYHRKTVVGSLNAAYRRDAKLTLTARAYLRAFQVDENQEFKALRNGTTPGQGNQLDKTTLRGDLLANYKATDKLRFNAGYRIEYNNRRDAEAGPLATAARFWLTPSGVYQAQPGEIVTKIAHNDVKHILTVGARAELPLGIYADGSYKRLQATEAALANQFERMDDANLSVTAPLPKDVELTLMAGYLNGASHMAPFNHAETRNTYRASFDWMLTNRVSFGADASYESIRTVGDDFLGQGATTAAGVTPANAGAVQWKQEVTHAQRNKVAGARGRFELPKGFVVKGDGYYTWMTVRAPLQWPLVNMPGLTRVDDWSPRDIRVARGGATVEYTPPKYRNLTARASYRVDDWVDKTDSNNSGRASVGELGMSAKF